jgi:hypothetical protein
MIELELNNLETHIDNIIDSLQKQKIENDSLHKKVSNLHQERLVFLDKKKKMAATLKKIITQLQDELSCQTQQ